METVGIIAVCTLEIFLGFKLAAYLLNSENSFWHGLGNVYRVLTFIGIPISAVVGILFVMLLNEIRKEN